MTEKEKVKEQKVFITLNSVLSLQKEYSKVSAELDKVLAEYSKAGANQKDFLGKELSRRRRDYQLLGRVIQMLDLPIFQ